MNGDDRSTRPRGGSRKRGTRPGGQGDSPNRPGPGRRMPPPDTTGEEGKLLERLCLEEATVTVELTGGQSVVGLIERYGPQVIEVGTGDGNTVVVRKSDIRYIVDG